MILLLYPEITFARRLRNSITSLSYKLQSFLLETPHYVVFLKSQFFSSQKEISRSRFTLPSRTFVRARHVSSCFTRISEQVSGSSQFIQMSKTTRRAAGHILLQITSCPAKIVGRNEHATAREKAVAIARNTSILFHIRGKTLVWRVRSCFVSLWFALNCTISLPVLHHQDTRTALLMRDDSIKQTSHQVMSICLQSAMSQVLSVTTATWRRCRTSSYRNVDR